MAMAGKSPKAPTTSEHDSSDDDPIINDDVGLVRAIGGNVLINTDRVDINEDPPVFRQRRHYNDAKNKYESLDYDVCENELWTKDQVNQGSSSLARKDLARWIIFIEIGVCTALVACVVDICIEEISSLKYAFLKQSVDRNMLAGDLLIPYLYYVLTNIVPVAVGSYLVAYIEPVAAGSGVPQVKSYLNGVKVPRIVRIKTLVVKVAGVITSVVGGLAGGKEGPMIHAGAVIAAGVSQGKSTTFRRDFGVFRYFRDDHEKRDFVVGGASAGVSAAFGAPLGGVLFSLEEAASFWNQNLIWRTMVASIISSFTLNLVLSAYHGLKSFSIPGLFNLGAFEALPYEYFEIPIFVLMGMFGGIVGAIWNAVNTQLTIFRTRFIIQKWGRVLEAISIAALSATVACLMMFLINDCRPLGVDPTPYPVQLFCEDNEYNAVAALWFQTPEASVKALFHDPPGSHSFMTLLIFVAVYYPLSCITFGLSVSLGIFIPSLLVGAAWGRLTAMTLSLAFPYWAFIQPSKYALIGAAAHLGGTLRMTISLTVILIESTGNISFALPLIVTLISAKWMGDYFNEGIYDTLISISKVPMLPWNVNRDMQSMKSSDIMNEPPICVQLKEETSYIVEILKKYSYNGFPVVDQVHEENRSNGRLRGFILRSQLIVILKRGLYVETQRHWQGEISIEAFRNEYPRFTSINKVVVKDEKMNFTVNSEMFMNPSPYSVMKEASVPRIFQLFRALGLRHLTVVDLENRVLGVITRKDFVHRS